MIKDTFSYAFPVTFDFKSLFMGKNSVFGYLFFVYNPFCSIGSIGLMFNFYFYIGF